MIRIFKPADTSFASNGDVVLQATKAKVRSIMQNIARRLRKLAMRR